MPTTAHTAHAPRVATSPARKADHMSFRDTLVLLASCCALSSVAGLAYLLRSGQVISWRTTLAALLWNGLAGLAMSSVGFHFLGEKNMYLLVGMSILAGIGSVSILDFLWQFLTGRVSVSVRLDRSERRIDD